MLKEWAPPTPAQAAAGNYYKPTIAWRGLTIKVENPAGSVRRWPGGETVMSYDYGYLAGTEGVDGDGIDVYVGPSLEFAPTVYVIHQRKAGDWECYDEDKAMLGFLSEDQARHAYMKHYDDPRFMGSVTAMPVEEFKRKVLASKEKPKMIKSNDIVRQLGDFGGQAPRVLFFKSYVRAHTRRTKDGKMVQVGPYSNKVMARPDVKRGEAAPEQLSLGLPEVSPKKDAAIEGRKAAFEGQKERALDDALRWANKEKGEYGTDWMRANLAEYLAERWSLPLDYMQAEVEKRFRGDKAAPPKTASADDALDGQFFVRKHPDKGWGAFREHEDEKGPLEEWGGRWHPTRDDAKEEMMSWKDRVRGGGENVAPAAAGDAETDLRATWTEQGVSKERQDELIRQIGEKAKPGAKVGPFVIAGARKATKEGQDRVDAAKARLREIINNPDIIGKQRADMIAGGRNLIQFLEANAARDLDTGYHGGDMVAYTGEDAPDGWRAFIYLEGHKAGEYGVARSNEARAADVAKQQSEWREQQQGFKRLHTANKEGPDSDEEIPAGKSRKFYVTMFRDGRKNPAWLAGPFDTHDEAKAQVDAARKKAQEVDNDAIWDAFGTASYVAEDGKHHAGVLNERLGLGKKAVPEKKLGAKARRALEVLRDGGHFRKQLETQYRGGEKFVTRLYDKHRQVVPGLGEKTKMELEPHMRRRAVQSDSSWPSEWELHNDPERQ